MSETAETLTIAVPFTLRSQGGRKRVITPAGTSEWAPPSARIDNSLVKALARAFRWQRLLETGRYQTLRELAKAERINPSYLSRILRLTLLAPDIVEAILDGRQPEGMTLVSLMEDVPVVWSEQRFCK